MYNVKYELIKKNMSVNIWLLSIVSVLVLLKFLFMLVVLILKIKYLNKKDENKELASICKTTYLEFTNIKNECYIVPTIVISKHITGITLEFKWLNIYYSNFWRVITTEQENMYFNASFNKNK